MAEENGSSYERIINSWALYHWADNAFSTTVVSAILPVYYSKGAASTLSANTATTYWGYTSAIMVIISAFLAPVFGALANIYGLRKQMLLSFMEGAVQGGAQALSRSLYGSMILKSKTAEFFGF